MIRNVNTSKLTKAYIESKISQELILSKYLDIPLDVIQNCIKHRQLIPSVFREDDTNCSMGIQYNKKGKLKVRDFGGFGFFDDVYGVVAYVLSVAYGRTLSTNNKQDFYFVLKHIAFTFSDIISNKEIDTTNLNLIKHAAHKCKRQVPIIEIVPRSWNSNDRKYWNHLGVTLNYLNTNFVIPVDQYYINRTINDEPKYHYTSNDPCYAYMLGQDKRGIWYIKLYFPFRHRERNELKFITNNNVLEGLMNLESDSYDYILITKSSKDRLSIGCHVNALNLFKENGDKYNIGIINLPSENYDLKQIEYDYLENKLNDTGIIVSLLDFDNTGRLGAKKLRDKYNIPYIFITRGEYGLPNYKAKDFADLHDFYSITEIDNFIKSTLIYAETNFK